MILKLEFITKNKNFIFYFLFILNSYFQKNQNFVYRTCCQLKKKNRKVVTVLKSPHVNKKAKKKFIYCIFKINITIILIEKKKMFLLYKLITLKSFVDFKIELFFKNNIKKIFFKNFTLSKLSKKSYITKYMFLLDSCGEKLFMYNCSYNINV